MNRVTDKQRKQRLIALCVAGFLGLNFPILSLFDSAELTFGIPTLFLYLFVFWALFIVGAALMIETNREEEG
jgi:hypothetical protein